jgi:hypothetical protein
VKFLLGVVSKICALHGRPPFRTTAGMYLARDRRCVYLERELGAFAAERRRERHWHENASLAPQFSRCLREAIRADAMTECRIAAFRYVLLDPHPALVRVSDSLAVHAGGEDPFEPRHAIL